MRRGLALLGLGVLLGLGASLLLHTVGAPNGVATPAHPVPMQTGASEQPEPLVSHEELAEPLEREPHPLVDRGTVAAPWGETRGLTMFRGNPTRTYYGEGPVPQDPQVLWRYPEEPMCMIEALPFRQEREWCGTGWTGQPLVWERQDGVTEVIVGAYDGAVHFVDGHTGLPTRAPFRTGHMVKGTETLDPDGYPLLYSGSRDGRLRIIALDGHQPRELWALQAHPQRVWNDDWDGSPAIVGGIMYVGGEDSWFYAIRLNRTIGDDGRVAVAPETILQLPSFDDDLFARIGDTNVSIESSVALYEGRVYFANSGGRVLGVDVNDADATGEAPVVFDFWTGDDTDATITIDSDGMLYVAVELERFLPRAGEVGQLVKLDPYTGGDPIVWSVHVPPRADVEDDDGGIWATPALHGDTLYVPTHAGNLLGVDTATGAVTYQAEIGYHEWGSPAVVDDTLVVPLCRHGGLRGYDVSTREPVTRWDVALGGCVESTPAVWDGRIYVGSRDGYLYAVGDRS